MALFYKKKKLKHCEIRYHVDSCSDHWGQHLCKAHSAHSQCLRWLNTAVTTAPQRLSEIKKAHQLQPLRLSALVFTNSNSSNFQRRWFSLLQHIIQGLVKGISFGFSQTIGLDRQFLCNNCIPTFFYLYDFSFSKLYHDISDIWTSFCSVRVQRQSSINQLTTQLEPVQDAPANTLNQGLLPWVWTSALLWLQNCSPVECK